MTRYKVGQIIFFDEDLCLGYVTEVQVGNDTAGLVYWNDMLIQCPFWDNDGIIIVSEIFCE